MKLPPPQTTGKMPIEQVLAARRSLRSFAPGTLTPAELGQLLWSAQGVTAPGGARTAPSACATFPLETYAVVGAVADLPPAVYRYEPATHELTVHLDRDLRLDVARASWEQMWMAEAPVIVAIATVAERNVKRFGPHGLHFIDMEVGHAAQNLALQAVALAMGTVMVGAFDAPRVHTILALPQQQAARYLIPVGRPK